MQCENSETYKIRSKMYGVWLKIPKFRSIPPHLEQKSRKLVVDVKNVLHRTNVSMLGHYGQKYPVTEKSRNLSPDKSLELGNHGAELGLFVTSITF